MDDYADILNKHQEVKKASADLRWTGSWYTIFISIDRMGSLSVDNKFKAKIRDYLNDYRLAGYDVEIRGPIYVPIDIRMIVYVAPTHLKSEVKQALSEIFIQVSFNIKNKLDFSIVITLPLVNRFT